MCMHHLCLEDSPWQLRARLTNKMSSSIISTYSQEFHHPHVSLIVCNDDDMGCIREWIMRLLALVMTHLGSILSNGGRKHLDRLVLWKPTPAFRLAVQMRGMPV